MGMVTLRIKRVERIASKPANPLQKIPETRLGKRKMGELCVGYVMPSIVCDEFSYIRSERFGEEKQAYDQSAYTWSVKAHDKNTLGADKPSTYVSFVFRYRSRGALFELWNPAMSKESIHVVKSTRILADAGYHTRGGGDTCDSEESPHPPHR